MQTSEEKIVSATAYRKAELLLQARDLLRKKLLITLQEVVALRERRRALLQATQLRLVRLQGGPGSQRLSGAHGGHARGREQPALDPPRWFRGAS